MKEPYYHGSPTYIDGSLSKGTCVSSTKCNALIFALRYRRGDCYIYSMLLDSTTDLERQEDAVGTVDKILVRDTPFAERILVTDELIAECRTLSVAAGLLK
jgi:hypothetical protein